MGYQWIYATLSHADTASIQDHPPNPSEGFGFLLQKDFLGPQKTNKQTPTNTQLEAVFLKIWKPTPCSSEE